MKTRRDVEWSEDDSLLTQWNLAFDRDEAEDVDVRCDRREPWNSDEDLLRDFHRAVTHRVVRSLSGRML